MTIRLKRPANARRRLLASVTVLAAAGAALVGCSSGGSPSAVSSAQGGQGAIQSIIASAENGPGGASSAFANTSAIARATSGDQDQPLPLTNDGYRLDSVQCSQDSLGYFACVGQITNVSATPTSDLPSFFQLELFLDGKRVALCLGSPDNNIPAGQSIQLKFSSTSDKYVSGDYKYGFRD